MTMAADGIHAFPTEHFGTPPWPVVGVLWLLMRRRELRFATMRG